MDFGRTLIYRESLGYNGLDIQLVHDNVQALCFSAYTVNILFVTCLRTTCLN